MENKEFLMTDKDYRYISKRVYDACGIVLSEQKKDMVYARISRRVRAHGLTSFSQYIDYLNQNESTEFVEFINSITTNLTSFFRERHHFEFLSQTAINEIKQTHQGDRRVRIWSAGCSLGMEPYSIAMTIQNAFPSTWDLKILATDLDTNVLATARQGIYEENQIDGIEEKQLKQYFLFDANNRRYKAKPLLGTNIHFKQLNLLKPWPMSGPFDVIFCRNVIIYFDNETKLKLFSRFASMLAPGGYLILGHSETISRETKEFQGLGQNIYRKVT